MMEELVMAQFNVICHTDGCENADITIEVSAVEDFPFVVCGPCGIKIEDVILVG